MAKRRRLFLAPQAADQLDSIYGPLFSDIQKRIEPLQDSPEMGRALTGDLQGWRVTPVGVYLIFYRVTRRGVEIGHVRHAKRQYPESLQ